MMAVNEIIQQLDQKYPNSTGQAIAGVDWDLYRAADGVLQPLRVELPVGGPFLVLAGLPVQRSGVPNGYKVRTNKMSLDQEVVNRIRTSYNECIREFYSARDRGDWDQADRQLRLICCLFDNFLREGERMHAEIRDLSTELELYRPSPQQITPAPPLEKHIYLNSTSKYSFVCIAEAWTEIITHGFGVYSYQQEHLGFADKAICGKKSGAPVWDRQGSGGWPRLRDLCPDCTRKALKMSILQVNSEDNNNCQRVQGRLFE